MKRTFIKSICLALFFYGFTLHATAQGIVVNKLDGTKVYFKASEVVSVGVYGYGEGPDDASDIHEYVDLGLPSGTLWATMNVGASKPEERGDYFAWGETKPKDVYTESNYKYYDMSFNTITKYCTRSADGSIDNKTELEMSDDAATVNWGINWETPSEEQFRELIRSGNTTISWTKLNDVEGCLIVSNKNGNRIFLPGTGYYKNGTIYPSYYGAYWANSLSIGSANIYARDFYFYIKNDINISSEFRHNGLSVRPVRAQR